MEEIWKEINFAEYYFISNLGRVKSVKKGNENILVQVANGRGYLSVCLRYNKKGNTKRVHVLVAQFFLNHKPNGNNFYSVDHIDNDKKNNKVSNLQVITHSENISKQVKNKSGHTGIKISSKNSYYAYVSINNKYLHLGTFKKIEDAILARKTKLEEIKNNNLNN